MFNLKYVTISIVAAKHIYDPPSDNSMHNSHHGASNHYDNMSVFYGPYNANQINGPNNTHHV